MRLYKNILLLGVFISIIVVFAIVLFFEESTNNNYSSNNFIIGKVTLDTQVEVLQVLPKNCSFVLYDGWNMVSFYCFGMFVDRNVGLVSLNDSYSEIFTYKATDSTDPWKSYNRDLPTWAVQQVNYMDRISGYLIYMTNESNFTYNGIYSNSIIPLRQGWNMISYPRNVSSNINDTLNGVAFSVVRHYDAITDTWYSYVVGSGSNTITQFETDKGYWVNVTSNSQLNIST